MKKNKTNEVVDTAQEERRLREQAVAKRIESILIEEGFALQPYILYSEYGTAPRVRLVENNQEINGQGNSEDQAEVSGDTDSTTEPVSA